MDLGESDELGDAALEKICMLYDRSTNVIFPDRCPTRSLERELPGAGRTTGRYCGHRRIRRDRASAERIEFGASVPFVPNRSESSILQGLRLENETKWLTSTSFPASLARCFYRCVS